MNLGTQAITPTGEVDQGSVTLPLEIMPAATTPLNLDGVVDVQANRLTGSDGTKGDSEQLSYNDGFSLSVYRNAAYGTECATDSDRQD